MEFEGLEVGEVADGGGDWSGEVGVGDGGEDGERVDAVRFGIAGDGVPVAAISVGVPGGEEVGVVEVFLDLEEDLLVRWIAELRESRGKQYEKETQAKHGCHVCGLIWDASKGCERMMYL